MDIKKFLKPKPLIILGVALVGGLFLASRLRPKASAASSDEEVEVIARPILQPYGVDTNPPAYNAGGVVPIGGDKPAPAPPQTDKGTVTTPPKAPAPAPPKPPVVSPTPPGSSPGQLPPRAPAPTLPGTPRRDTTPAPPSTPPATPNVPGGYPLDCRGVLPRPSDHPGADVSALVRAKGGGARGRAIALHWVIMGISANAPLGLSRTTLWLANKSYWPLVNQTRRNRGLKALTATQLEQLLTNLHQLNAMTRGQDDKFNDTQLQQLWITWHVPYLC